MSDPESPGACPLLQSYLIGALQLLERRQEMDFRALYCGRLAWEDLPACFGGKRQGSFPTEAPRHFPCFLRHRQVAPGSRVCVVEDFRSDSKVAVELRQGQLGIVDHIDAQGDARVDFEDHPELHWVFESNFDKISVAVGEYRAILDQLAEYNFVA